MNVTVPATRFLKLLSVVSDFAASNGPKFVRGVFVEAREDRRVVLHATDRYLLAQARIDLPAPVNTKGVAYEAGTFFLNLDDVKVVTSMFRPERAGFEPELQLVGRAPRRGRPVLELRTVSDKPHPSWPRMRAAFLELDETFPGLERVFAEWTPQTDLSGVTLSARYLSRIARAQKSLLGRDGTIRWTFGENASQMAHAELTDDTRVWMMPVRPIGSAVWLEP